MNAMQVYRVRKFAGRKFEPPVSNAMQTVRPASKPSQAVAVPANLPPAKRMSQISDCLDCEESATNLGTVAEIEVIRLRVKVRSDRLKQRK
ncbi:hypothetical protein IQ270_18360 [Microcoleus sp. LEGE 07076]|uniref:hypothetical protein n=1 Tax=Microcoleus sp. LEGE 07076 TaxID=915322 RepID=UPI00188093E0|nr:hypothetical protein [Microcoleus sp. LEGE 07076]MBE9186596.1 hypothetical protein [Microcoleus sp. LEGE 07076]